MGSPWNHVNWLADNDYIEKMKISGKHKMNIRLTEKGGKYLTTDQTTLSTEKKDQSLTKPGKTDTDSKSIKATVSDVPEKTGGERETGEKILFDTICRTTHSMSLLATEIKKQEEKDGKLDKDRLKELGLLSLMNFSYMIILSRKYQITIEGMEDLLR